ncbi:MAG: two-component sensor histidine kinase, partial [Bacillota bacterium]|nr:two-component sensor histidine kinase [Bacillota bacterium]
GEGQPALERYAAGREDGTSSGLGTAIAAEIIRAHFGSLIVSSADGLTMVTVLFPRDKLKNKERV